MRTQTLASLSAYPVALRRVGVVLLYVLVFVVAVPLQVWALGKQMDALLRVPKSTALQAPGVILLAMGASLWLSAHIWLSAVGRGLPISSLPPARLVASGPYRMFRHPIYVGFSLTAAGLGCAFESIGHGLLAPLILATACWGYVVSFEEPALRRRYGDAYGEVGRLLEASIWSRLWTRLRATAEAFARRTSWPWLGSPSWVTYGLFVAGSAFLLALLGRMAVGPLCSSRQYVGYLFGALLATALGTRLETKLRKSTAVGRRGLAMLRPVGIVSWPGYLGLLVFTAAFGAATEVSALAILDRVIPLVFLWMAVDRVASLTGSRRCVDSLRGAIVDLLAAGLAFALSQCNSAVGTTTLFAALWHFLTRLGFEPWRDERRFGGLEWTPSQWVAAGGAGLSLLGLMSLDPSSSVAVVRGSLDVLSVEAAVAVGGIVFLVSSPRLRRVGGA